MLFEQCSKRETWASQYRTYSRSGSGRAYRRATHALYCCTPERLPYPPHSPTITATGMCSFNATDARCLILIQSLSFSSNPQESRPRLRWSRWLQLLQATEGAWMGRSRDISQAPIRSCSQRPFRRIAVLEAPHGRSGVRVVFEAIVQEGEEHCAAGGEADIGARRELDALTLFGGKSGVCQWRKRFRGRVALPRSRLSALAAAA